MPLVIAPAILLAGLVLLALAVTSHVWAKAIGRSIAARRGGGLLAILTLPITLLARVVLPVAHYLSHAITKAASHYMHPVASWLTALAHRQLQLTGAAVGFAEGIGNDVAHGFEIKVPREIRKRLGLLAKKAGGALILAGLTRAALRRFARGIDRLLHEKIIPQVRRLERELTVTLPRELGRIRARARALEDEIRNPSRAFLRRLASRLWLLGLAGLMIRALARRFPWLFCRKVKAVGSRVCGLDNDLLNSLLLDTLLIAGTISVVEMAREMQAIESAAVGLMSDFIDEL